MLYANIHIDLPSEPELRRRTLVDWLMELLGRELDLGTTTQIATFAGLGVFKAVTDALERLGITDVMSVIVDGRTAYVDTDEDSGDLATAVAELDARAVLEDEFEVMKMALSHRHEGLHTLVEVTLRRRVEGGDPELDLSFAARLDSMQIQRGETPSMYAARLRELARDSAALRWAQARFSVLIGQAERILAEQLGELCVASSIVPARLRLIRPGPRQLDHFRRLSWGATVRLPRYRPLPIASRRGAYDAPFYHYYFDPYFDFVAWVTIEEIVAGRGWVGHTFVVVDPDGTTAFDQDSAAGQAAIGAAPSPSTPGAALVEIRDDRLVVDAAVPELGMADPGEFGDPGATPGYGGDEGWTEVAAGGNAGEISGGDLGGSCGASCGGCGGS